MNCRVCKISEGRGAGSRAHGVAGRAYIKRRLVRKLLLRYCVIHHCLAYRARWQLAVRKRIKLEWLPAPAANPVCARDEGQGLVCGMIAHRTLEAAAEPCVVLRVRRGRVLDTHQPLI